jgi:hypothetical protein
MKTHKYSNVVDGITFTGTYEREDVDTFAIFTLCTLEVQGIDLMLVVDPRVVHEIERALLDDWLWNEDRV